MELDLDIGRGRPRKQVQVAVTRELGAEDLPRLAEPRAQGGGLKKLRDRHHSLARFIADGMSYGEASIATGYNKETVTLLMQDPTFLGLVEFYRGQKQEKYLDMHELLGALGRDAVRELLDRMEDPEEKISVKELRELAQFASDRSGYGPTNKQEVSHVINFGERLEAARRRAVGFKDGSPQPVLEAEIVDDD